MILHSKRGGFTLIEILLVIIIIGLMLAVIVPRAWRANVDTKYSLVRQNCSELASFGMQWAEKQLGVQNEFTSTSDIDTYLSTLAGTSANTWPNATWIALQTESNWNKNATNHILVPGRALDGATDTVPNSTVENMVAPEKIPRNPFNSASIFLVSNDPASLNSPITGAIACGTVNESNLGNSWHYYAFVFTGTDSTSINLDASTSFHAGMAAQTAPGLRNGIFFARLRPNPNVSSQPDIEAIQK